MSLHYKIPENHTWSGHPAEQEFQLIILVLLLLHYLFRVPYFFHWKNSHMLFVFRFLWPFVTTAAWSMINIWTFLWVFYTAPAMSMWNMSSFNATSSSITFQIKRSPGFQIWAKYRSKTAENHVIDLCTRAFLTASQVAGDLFSINKTTAFFWRGRRENYCHYKN